MNDYHIKIFLKQLVFILFLFFVNFSFSQNLYHENRKDISDSTFSDLSFLKVLAKYKNLKELKNPYNYKGAESFQFPDKLDNSLNIYFPPISNQQFWDCGQHSGVGYNFTYEMNLLRGLDSKKFENQYPPDFTFNFLNQGFENIVGVSYFDSWNILKQVGSPTFSIYISDYEDDFSSHTMWMSGYDKYFNAMQNRVLDYYSIDVSTSEGLNTLKHWLYNHFDSSKIGGLANFYSCSIWASQISQLEEGTPEEGKWVITRWNSSINHAMTIVGYNDSIRYDYNNDGIFSNDIDINNDNIVDMKDWEIGGLQFANSYGSSWADSGKAYFMYKLLAESVDNGGIWNNAVHILKPIKNYKPKLTLDLQIEHSQRNMLKVATGFTYNINDDEPTNIYEFPIFNFQGGSNNMQGFSDVWAKIIEIGLDISFLLNEIEPERDVKIFVLIYEKDVDSIADGKILSAKIIDYQRNTKKEFIENSIDINNNSLTKVGIPFFNNSSSISIETVELPDAQIFEPFEYQLIVNGGTPAYTWNLDYSYKQESFQHSFPDIQSNELFFNSFVSGSVSQKLDFSFPFYNNFYDSVIITTEGTIVFCSTDIFPYYNNSAASISINKVIAPFGSDLRIITAQDDGIWYEGNENIACFRWQLSTEMLPLRTVVNFAAKLYSSGVIEFFYGEISDNDSINSIIENQYWFSGISNGDDKHYCISDFSNVCVIPKDYSIRFIPPEFPEGVELSESGLLSFTPVINNKKWNINVVVSDSKNRYAKSTLIVSTNKTVQLQKFHSMLEQNFPNPFSQKTSLSFYNDNAGFVKLEIYNIHGELVKTILNEFMDIGTYSIDWNCKNEQNEIVSYGIYFVRLSLKNEKFVKKMIFL